MKIITKSKLPRWLIHRIPFGEEEQSSSSMIVPMILFPLMAIGIMWYEVYVPSLVIVESIGTIALVAIDFSFSWWLMVQIDILAMLRKRYSIHYKIAKDQDDKIKTEQKLADLCVTV